jgi:hypothetical protein
MNYNKNKKINQLCKLLMSITFLINCVGCSINTKPVNTEKVNVTVTMKDTLPEENVYTVSMSTTTNITTVCTTSYVTNIISSTNTNITTVLDICTDDITTIGLPESNTEQTEMEDYKSVVSPIIVDDIVSKKSHSSIISTTQTTSCSTTISENVTTEIFTNLDNVNNVRKFVKTFSRGTYYPYPAGTKGGSTRTLIDCSIGDGNVKGSIASSYLYSMYGYNRDGRTKVYLEVPTHSEMNGYYYVDDCDAWNPNVIDFYYYSANNCPFQLEGVVTVNCYID